MKAPFQTVRQDIAVTSPVVAKLKFQHAGGDNHGLFLDNVKLMKINDFQVSPKKTKLPSEVKNEEYYVQKSKVAFEKKDWKSAKKYIEEGLQKFPDSAELWHSLAGYYFRNRNEPPERRSRETIRSMFQAYKLNPSGKFASEMGWLHRQINQDCTLALSYFEEAEKKGYAGEKPSLLYWMGTCYEKIGMYDSAKTYYYRFLKTAKGHEKQSEAEIALQRLKKY